MLHFCGFGSPLTICLTPGCSARSLIDCGITSKELMLLAPALGTCPSLETLNLSKNSLISFTSAMQVFAINKKLTLRALTLPLHPPHSSRTDANHG